jgi:hypothetical protein
VTFSKLQILNFSVSKFNSKFQIFRVSSQIFRVSSQIFKVSEFLRNFQSFRVSNLGLKFQSLSFRVSKSKVKSQSLSFRFSEFLSYKVSEFQSLRVWSFEVSDFHEFLGFSNLLGYKCLQHANLDFFLVPLTV